MARVDMQAALDELGLEKSHFVKFVGDLRKFLDETLPRLHAAAATGDCMQTGQIAHSIKGALATLRFIEAAEIAHQLEKSSAAQETDEVTVLLAKLETVLHDSYRELGF